jgi:uncharacterized protein YodC (DUF2158 family)
MASEKPRAQFKVGDIVQLKSGGPMMSVQNINKGDTYKPIECSWFAGKKHETARFSAETLKHASSPDENADSK